MGFLTNGPLVLGTKNFKFFSFFISLSHQYILNYLFVLCKHHLVHETFTRFTKVLSRTTELQTALSLLVSALHILSVISQHLGCYNLCYHLKSEFLF